jgi:hypothetical protein
MKPFARTLLSGLIAIALAASAAAQAPAPAKTGVPDEARTVEAVIDAQLRLAERPETAARVAAFKRNLYEALLKKGFTGDQAMQITIATPLPSPLQNR